MNEAMDVESFAKLYVFLCIIPFALQQFPFHDFPTLSLRTRLVLPPALPGEDWHLPFGLINHYITMSSLFMAE